MKRPLTHQTGWMIPFFLALCVHAVALAFAMFSPSFLTRKAIFPEIQTVELINFIDLSTKSIPTATPQHASKTENVIKKAPAVVPKTTAPPVPKVQMHPLKKIESKPQQQQPVKTKDIISFNPVKQRQAALERIAARVEERIKNEKLLKLKLEQLTAINNQQLAEEKAREATKNAVTKLKDFYRQHNNTQGLSNKDARQITGQSDLPATSGTSTDKKIDDQQMTYWTSVLVHIQNFWILPDLQKKWDKNLEAVYVIKVRRDGIILKKYFERKSENFYFNTFVEKTVKDADPLPAFPAGFKDNEMEIGLIFHPAGLL